MNINVATGDILSNEKHAVNQFMISSKLSVKLSGFEFVFN